jgi:hypothetical protein
MIHCPGRSELAANDNRRGSFANVGYRPPLQRMEATSLRGCRGVIPLGGSRPYVRRDNFVPSVWELGIALGVWERASQFGEGGSPTLTSEQGSQAMISKLKRKGSDVRREAVR